MERSASFYREFHQALPQLLKPDGLYSFFNGCDKLCSGQCITACSCQKAMQRLRLQRHEWCPALLLRLAADNAFFHSVCCRIVAAELAR